MARPQKNNLDYFSHDCDMRNDIKIKALRNKFSHKGYSIYNMVLEHLADCDYFQYEWNELNILLLSSDFDIEVNELLEIIDFCIKLQLFSLEEGFLFCATLHTRNVHILPRRTGFDFNNSPIMKLKLQKQYNNDTETELMLQKPNNNLHRIEKERIEKERIEKERIEKENIPNKIIKEIELEEIERKAMLDGVNSLRIPDKLKYDFQALLEGIATPKQKENLLDNIHQFEKTKVAKELILTFK